MTNDLIDDPEIWRPLTGMPEDASRYALQDYRTLEPEWNEIQRQLKDREKPRAFVDAWLEERYRAFAIETGQIEGLYTLKRGITEQLIAEGLEGVTQSHTLEGVEDDTIRGLLLDQREALEMVFQDVTGGRPLTGFMVRSWHGLITRHQKTVTGIARVGNQIQRREMPFETKGQWKIQPNNPRRQDGVTHEYCPPEFVRDEMDRFFELHGEIAARRYPVEVEAAWMHHRFVRTHPFQDGNGRVSRLLMAYAYIKRSLPPPVVSNEIRDDYIDALEYADRGDLGAFISFIGALATPTLLRAVRLGREALRGHLSRPNGNGGRTVGQKYLPPVE